MPVFEARLSIPRPSDHRDGFDRPGTVPRGPHSFQRASRLTRPVEFRRVFSRPVVSRDRYFRILSRANDLGHSRLGLAVSIKVCKQAPGRNRLKRLVRESFRHQLPVQAGVERGVFPGEREGFDFVVLPTREAASMCNERLTASLERHWNFSLEKHRSNRRPTEGKN